MNKIVVAIDGYSACGKSTIARSLALDTGYTYIDSGAMYRAITLFFLQNNTDSNDEAAVQIALQKIHLAFVPSKFKAGTEMYLNNENVENEIRNMQVSEQVSKVAAVEAVRSFAVRQQQRIGAFKGIVMDGRDIGTTVFPNAELKIFVTANISIRAGRRYKELTEKGETITLEEVKANLQKRDEADANRAISPLRKAADAIVLDTSYTTQAEQLFIVTGWMNDRLTKLQ